MARRLSDQYVQYGWSGNSGFFCNCGTKLLCYYNAPHLVDYLFSLGQLSSIGKPGSEKWDYFSIYKHGLTNSNHYVGSTEKEFFGKLMFIDHGYFYDSDQTWYYVNPGPFRIKVPLETVSHHLDEHDFEFKFFTMIEDKLIHYILTDYLSENSDFSSFLESNQLDASSVLSALQKSDCPIYDLYCKYSTIFHYFDDWVVVKTDDSLHQVTGFILKKNSDHHIETIHWR